MVWTLQGLWPRYLTNLIIECPRYTYFGHVHVKYVLSEFVKGSQLLKEKDSEIVFAKVDGTEQEELRSKMKIEGYPTLYFYREGEYIKYKGGRMAREMVEWVEKKIGPDAEPLATTEDVDNAISDSDVVVIGFFKDQTSDQAKNYLKVSFFKHLT